MTMNKFVKELYAREDVELDLRDTIPIFRVSKKEALELIQNGVRIMEDDHGKYFKDY